jgi:hypothetical protein
MIQRDAQAHSEHELVKAYSDYAHALTELKACKDALRDAQHRETAALNKLADARKTFLSMIAQAAKSDPDFSLAKCEFR